MVCTRTSDFAPDVPESSNARAGAASIGPRGPTPELPPPPPPLPSPVSLEQLLAMQNELMQVLMENLIHRGGCQPHHLPVMDSSYTNFLVMHPLTFAEVTDPFLADIWLRILESKFGLLHCTEFQ
jgi:hypothetical protein